MLYFKTHFGTKDEDGQASGEDGGAGSGVELVALRDGENVRSPYHVQKKAKKLLSSYICRAECLEVADANEAVSENYV